MNHGFLRGQRGISFVETVVAMGLLAIIGVAFLTALQTISINTRRYDERVTALGLAESQVERLKAVAYDAGAPASPDSYAVSVAAPPGYSISISEVQQGDRKQEVTVAVSREGRPVFHLKTIKADQ